MNSLHISRIALSVRARIPGRAFTAYFPSPVESLGKQLASQVHECVRKLELGYYPALEFIKQQDCVEQFILDALEQVSEYALQWSKNEIYSLLRPVFSNVSIESIQLVCNTLPGIRPGQNHAQVLLAAHFTPDTIKFELNVAIVQKQAFSPGVEKNDLQTATKKTVLRWLNESFTAVNISSTRME